MRVSGWNPQKEIKILNKFPKDFFLISQARTEPNNSPRARKLGNVTNHDNIWSKVRSLLIWKQGT